MQLQAVDGKFRESERRVLSYFRTIIAQDHPQHRSHSIGEQAEQYTLLVGTGCLAKAYDRIRNLDDFPLDKPSILDLQRLKLTANSQPRIEGLVR